MKEKIIDFFTLKRPIGRVEYFIPCFIFLFLRLVLVFILSEIEIPEIVSIALILFLTIFLLLSLYVDIVLMIKRFWDIFESRLVGIILTILWGLISILFALFYKENGNIQWFIMFVYGVTLLFVRGRITGKKEEVSLSTQAEGDSQEG